MYKVLIVLCLITGLHARAAVKLPAPNAPLLKPRTTVKPPVQYTLKLDSSKVNLRKFDSAALARYAKDPDFDYDTDIKKGDSLWNRFWRWFWELIEKVFGGRRSSSGQSPGFAKYLFIALAIGLVVFIVIKLIGVENIFSRESKPAAIPYSESLENIHEISFDQEIESAMAQRNYRLAVRLLYLRSLKQLNDAGLIQWQLEKTNSAYINELKNSGQRQTFSVLTRQFEYVWYGDFPVNGQAFQNIDMLFQDFKKMIP